MSSLPLTPLPSWDSEATWVTFENGGYHGWIGEVEIQKCDDDLDRYRELVEVSQPDIVIETGTRQGGSALFFRSLGLQVITIDINPDAGAEARRQNPHDYDVHWWTGSSIAPGTRADAQRLLDGKRVMVSLDSDHHASHVEAEIELWGPFVTPGCFLVVEDACFEMWDAVRARRGGHLIPERGGPLAAMRNSSLTQSRAPMFWRDEELESLTSVSHSPCGWWRRND